MIHKKWTPEDLQYLRDHSREQTDLEMSKNLWRSRESITQKRTVLGLRSSRPMWTADDEAYLMDKWGNVSIPSIAKYLGRSIVSVKIRAQRLGLGAVLESGDYVTLNQLIRVFQNSGTTAGYQMKSWVANRGFPVHTKRVVNNTFRVVYLNEFWIWAEKHRSFLDFSKMEPLSLGKEPDWVAQQRKIDAVSFANQRKDPWTRQEDQRLAHLLKQHKYTWAEMSRELRRSAGAIQRRCIDLGLKERPVRESPHNPWSPDDLQLMADMIRQGCSYSMIGEACGERSEKAIRGVVFTKYHTESADKVRAMLGKAGPWGTGAPKPTVKSEKFKETVRKPITRLCELLLIRRNSMDFGEFWQRDMCQHWNDVRGCLMNCSNCDDCSKFQRIRVQHCRMCGSDFFERVEQIYCPKCRAMRKHQAQKKYAVLHQSGRI